MNASGGATRWWWVRHAPVTGHDGRLYGCSDPPCDVSNRSAFATLSEWLPEDAVWVASHLQRARRTAEAILAWRKTEPEVLVEPDLAEQNFGEWQGRSHAEVRRFAAPARHKFWYCRADYRPPGGETYHEVCARVAAAMARLSAAHAGRDIVAVSHGGPIRAALSMALGADPDLALSIKIDNLSVTAIAAAPGKAAGGDWRVLTVNRVPEGNPTT